MIKLFKPFISEQARQNVQRVLLTDQIAEGQEVKNFEYELEKKLGVSNLLTVNSGTSALELAYELAGIGAGDEVISPVLTCTATNLPLIRRGAKIVWADIENDLNISVEDVMNKITPKTKAVVFVHFGGNSRGLNKLAKLCKSAGLILIEDAAQAILSDNIAKGDFTCISLQAIKSITTGDGGILICKREDDYRKAKKLRWFGYDREEKQKLGDTDLEIAGYKYHMNNIQAAIGLGNIEHFNEIKTHLNALGEIYKSYGMFSHLWLAGGFVSDYKAFKGHMEALGYEIGQHHYRNDKYTVFGGREKLPIMDAIEDKYFFAPLHIGVTLKDAHIIGKEYEKCK